jgi:hypothetical protein
VLLNRKLNEDEADVVIVRHKSGLFTMTKNRFGGLGPRTKRGFAFEHVLEILLSCPVDMRILWKVEET